MNWFENVSDKEKKTAVKNAIVVMLADGKIADAEMNFLQGVCRRVGMNADELNELLSNLNAVEFQLAATQQERTFQLMDVVFMMMSDGNIDKQEMAMCSAIAAKLGFPPMAVPKLVESIVESIRRGQNRNQINLDIASYLK